MVTMDDEHGDVGPTISDISEPTVSLNVPNETIMENFERDNQINESYNEGDGDGDGGDTNCESCEV